MRFRPFRAVNGKPGAVAVHHGKEDQRRCDGNQRGDQPLLEMIEDTQEKVRGTIALSLGF